MMEKHRFLRLGLCLLLVSLQGITEISGASFTCSYLPANPVTLGAINSSLTCNHAPDTGEALTNIVLRVKQPPDTTFQEMFTVTFTTPIVIAFPDNSVANDYKNRIQRNLTYTSTVVTIPEIQCRDEVEFHVTLSSSLNSAARTATASVSVTVQAPARSPQAFAVTPTGQVTEYTLMNFTCTANVGTRPTGTISWELYLDGSIIAENVTSQSTTNVVNDTTATCTMVATSLLQLNVTRRHHQAVVRCQPVRSGQTTIPVYDQTAKLEVLYRVLDRNVVVGMMPQKNPFVVGDPVTLTCTAVGNPRPSISWTKENSNWTATGSPVSITQLQMEDAGKYVCHATNNVSGTIFNASSSTNVVVVEVPPSTTTTSTSPGATSTTGKGGVTAPSSQTQLDNTRMIIGIVIGCVAFIVIVVIIIVCVVMKRRKNKEIEEPSEKPYNNHQNINVISSQPDLVNDDKKYNYYKDDLSPYIDPKPRSRRPVDLGSSSYDSTTYMPQV